MRILTVLFSLFCAQTLLAQNTAIDSLAQAKANAKNKFDYNKLNLKNRANDHFMFQLVTMPGQAGPIASIPKA